VDTLADTDRTPYRIGRLESVAQAVKNLVEQHAVWVVVGLLVVCFAWTMFVASKRLMWNDELYTYYIATLPRAADIWPALMTGAEQIPPSFHLLTRVVLRYLGVSNISVRLPEMLGFVVMMACLFRFVSRRSSAFYGVIAMLFPVLTRAYRYGYEARPYGLVLGFSGLALVSWQASTEGVRRWPALALLTLTLAGALASHYYAILVFFALAVGEVARSFSQRRVDVTVWSAFAVAAALPLLVFSPLILRARGYSATFWNPVYVGQVLAFYEDLLKPATLPLGATLLVALGYAMFRQPSPSLGRVRMPPVHEMAVAGGFIALPLIGFVIAAVITKAFVGRYFLPAVMGFSILVAFAVYSLPRGRALIGTALLLFLCGGIAIDQRDVLRTTREVSRDRFAAIELLQRHGSDLPIVASEPHIFMTLAYYAPFSITSRLVYLGDPDASLRRLGHNTVDRGMIELIGPWFHLPVTSYRSYIESHPRFFVYGNLGWLNWVTDELRADNRRLELRDRRAEEFLFLVTRSE